MKRRVKQIISAFLLIVILGVGVNSNVYAAELEVTSIQEKKEYLITLGVPEDYLEMVSEEKISSMYERYFIKSRSNNDIIYRWDDYTVIEKDIQDGTAVARDTISTSKLSLTVGYMSELNSAGTSVLGVNVEVYFEWLSGPQMRNEDALTLNWASSVFNCDGLQAEVFGYIDGYYTECGYITQPAKLAAGGVGWVVPLTSPGHPGEIINNIQGGANIHLIPVDPITTSSGKQCTLNAEYTHYYLTPSISIDFSSEDNTVTVEPAVGQDNLISSYTWKASKRNGGN